MLFDCPCDLDMTVPLKDQLVMSSSSRDVIVWRLVGFYELVSGCIGVYITLVLFARLIMNSSLELGSAVAFALPTALVLFVNNAYAGLLLLRRRQAGVRLTKVAQLAQTVCGRRMEPQFEQLVRLRGTNASCARRLLRRLFECLRFGCGVIDLLLNYLCKGGAILRLDINFLIERADYSGWSEERQV